MIVDPYARIVTQLNSNPNFSITLILPKNKIDTSNVVQINHIQHFLLRRSIYYEQK